MKYFEEYISIIKNRQQNPLPEDVYGEWHHIIPKSICPILAKSKDNLVRLSAQEHFMSHYYIWRAYRDDLHEQSWARKMCYAFHQMKRVIAKCEDVEKMSLLYAEVKKDFAQNHPLKNPEARKKMSEAMKGDKNPMKRPEVKEKLMGDKSPMKNPEARKKQSEAMKERMKNPEARKKQSEAMKERMKKFFKKVLQCTLDGKLVSEFSSINDAMRETGCNKRSISKCCHGKRKTAGGFVWRFSDEVHADK